MMASVFIRTTLACAVTCTW